MRIATEISQHGVGPAEGRFAVDDPIGREERIDEGPPGSWVTQMLTASSEIELAAVVRASERLDVLPAKHPAQDLDGKKEARVLRIDPPLMIR
jgi:hypothetical protein